MSTNTRFSIYATPLDIKKILQYLVNELGSKRIAVALEWSGTENNISIIVNEYCDYQSSDINYYKTPTRTI